MLDNIKSFILESTDELELRQEHLNVIQQNVLTCLKGLLDNLPYKGVIIQSRVKDAISLNEKIIRKNYHINFMNSGNDRAHKFIDYLPDLIGVRLVCLLNTEEQEIYNSLRNIFRYSDIAIEAGPLYLTYMENDQKLSSHFSLCLENQPEQQKNGMDIYRIPCKWFDAERHDYINVELQIKSLTHLFWGELEHMMFYKNYSYIVGGDFYFEMMIHLERELDNIDKNLHMLTKQVKKDEYKQTNEIKQIAGMLVFATFNNKASNSLGFSIDLRDIYNLIVDMHFGHPIDGQILMRKFDSFVKKTNETPQDNLLEPKILSEVFDEREISLNGKYFAAIVNKLVNSGDIFWAYFYTIFKEINRYTNHTDIIKEISEGFSKMLKLYEADLPIFENDNVDEFIKNSIYLALASAFSEYKKLDFFIYGVNLLNILENTKNVINQNQDIFAELRKDQYEEIKELIEIYVKCCTLASCKVTISTADIIRIKELIDNTDIINIPFNQEEYDRLNLTSEYLQWNVFFEIFNDLIDGE